MKDWDKKLFKTLEHRRQTATDSRFLKKLSKWILELSGDVNVAMRLRQIAEKR